MPLLAEAASQGLVIGFATATFAVLGLLMGAVYKMIGALREEFAAFRTEMRVDFGALRSEVSELRGEVHAMRGELSGLNREVGELKVRFEYAGPPTAGSPPRNP